MNSLATYLTTTCEWNYLLRIIIAAFCGGCIGLEREQRLKNAGIRTHILVAMAAALMMIVSKYGFFDVVVFNSIQLDASRIAASVVSAIGFLGAGVIFVRKDNVIGVTTAAGLWGTVGVGITIGAGLFITGIFMTAFMILIQFVMHYKKLAFSRSISGSVTLIPCDQDIPISNMAALFKHHSIMIKALRAEKTDDGVLLTANVIFDRGLPLETQVKRLEEIGKVVSIDVAIYG